MKKNIIWIICFFIFLTLFILDIIYLHDKFDFFIPEEYEFAFLDGCVFSYLLEGLYCCIDDLFIKRIFKKKDPT